jgi:hypothetical protein
MRFTQQPWNSIVARLELVILGVGQVGLNPTVAIQRLADSQWLQAGGGAWGAGFAVNNLVQIDAANQPGMYEYVVPNARLDFVASLQGYRCKYVEVGIPVLEYEYLGMETEFNGQAAAGLATAGANNTVTLNVWAPGTANYFNDMLVTIVAGTGAGQTRRITTYTAGRVCTVMPNWGLNPDATSVCVIHAGGAADVRAWIGTGPNTLQAGRVDADVGNIQPAPRDAIVDFVWDEALAGHVGVGTTGAGLDTLLGLLAAEVLATGVVASTTGTTTTLDAGAAATADYYVNAKLVVISGTGAGQERVITGYTVGRVATHAAWTTNPTGASKYAIVPGLPSSLTIADIMTASMASYETAGTFGNHVNRILRLRQENMKVVYTAWSTHGQPTAGYVLVYASSADLGTDVAPWALAKGRYDFTATYDGDLQLTGYQSTRTL